MMRAAFCLVVLAPMFALAGCASRGGDWPTLAPRPGEITPMVPRNLPGTAADAGRCPAGECAPPAVAVAPAAPDLPPTAIPPTLAEARAEMATIVQALAEVEAAAGPLKARRDAARAEAAGAADDSAAMARLELAQSSLVAALSPLERLEYRLAALAAALETSPDGAALSAELAALAARMAVLSDQ